MSSIKEHLLKTLPHQAAQSETLTSFFFLKKNVVVRSFTADTNLLQPTGGVNSTPHTSHFHALACTHFHVAHVTLAQVWLSAHFISCVICMLCVA